MPPIHIRLREGELKCPYRGCGKSFKRPTILTDSSSMPRQSHYACPHCMSKIDIITSNLKIVDIRPLEYPKVFESPTKCAHYSSLQNAFSKDFEMPDECLVCPKILQCGITKKK